MIIFVANDANDAKRPSNLLFMIGSTSTLGLILFNTIGTYHNTEWFTVNRYWDRLV